eukprot:COSAG01_NODE_59168_length_301_cov_18.549505_1_plen_59_part_01
MLRAALAPSPPPTAITAVVNGAGGGRGGLFFGWKGWGHGGGPWARHLAAAAVVLTTITL